MRRGKGEERGKRRKKIRDRADLFDRYCRILVFFFFFFERRNKMSSIRGECSRSVPDIVAGIKWLTEKQPPNIHQLHSRLISECV